MAAIHSQLMPSRFDMIAGRKSMNMYLNTFRMISVLEPFIMSLMSIAGGPLSIISMFIKVVRAQGRRSEKVNTTYVLEYKTGSNREVVADACTA